MTIGASSRVIAGMIMMPFTVMKVQMEVMNNEKSNLRPFRVSNSIT